MPALNTTSSAQTQSQHKTPQQPMPFFYDNFSQTEAPNGKSNRNRNRRRKSRNNKIRRRTRTMSTNSANEYRNDSRNDGRNVRSESRYDSRSDGRFEGRNDGQHKDFRIRTDSNVSAGVHSTVSGMTNGSRRGSVSGRDSSAQRSGKSTDRQRQRSTRWDRDRLSREIWTFYLDNCQSPDLLTRKNRLRDALHKILTTNFPKWDVDLFIVGSTVNGMANNKSDVDICLVMNEIDGKTTEEKSNDSTIMEKLMPSNGSPTSPKVVESKPIASTPSTSAEKTEVAIIVNYEESDPAVDKSNLSIESIGTTASTASNGTNDSSIPMLEMVRDVLKAYNFVTKMQIILAKVPILKFVDRISQIEVTINVNKLVSIRNTHLIHDYTKCDWRLQPLVLVIKAWAKDHTINDAYNKSISSYSLVLMVVHYLQFACSPPVLPCLQQWSPNEYSAEREVKSIRMDGKLSRRWKSSNTSSLKELLVGFLDYYSYVFCYTKDAISIRLGITLPKHLVQRHKSEDNHFTHWKYLSIEEPFNRTNTARSVYEEVTFERIQSVFRVSHYTLRRYPYLDSIMTGKQYNNDYNQVIEQYVSDK